MAWLRWLVVALVALDAGYMVVDGTRALTRGDYITPGSGEHAGELGPWARVVESVGIDPRSTPMKAFFVVYGLVWLGVAAAFATGSPWSWLAMVLLAVGSVWYAVPGTVISVLTLALLFAPAVRDHYNAP
jgi:hypothetical protein